MNDALINNLESAKVLLTAALSRAINDRVNYEITTAKMHIQRAIEWEQSVDAIKAALNHK